MVSLTTTAAPILYPLKYTLLQIYARYATIISIDTSNYLKLPLASARG